MAMDDFDRRDRAVALLMGPIPERSESQATFAWSVRYRYALGTEISEAIRGATADAQRSNESFTPAYPPELLNLPVPR
jgi:hypothetical protein